MGGADRQAEVVGGEDGGHGDQFGAGALRVGQVLFADLFADRDHNALPAHHGAQPRASATATFTQVGDELGGLVHFAPCRC